MSLNWIPWSTVTVNYTTQNGTATAGSDYVAKSGTLTFNPGILFQTIAVPVNGDKVKEGDETFKIVLSSAYNATLYRSTATGTILDDDGGKSVMSRSSDLTAGAQDKEQLNQAAEISVRLSPVPARSDLHVSLAGFEGRLMMQVFSTDGRQVRQQAVNGSLQQSVDVSSLAAGSYLLVVSDEKGNRKTEKFIVSR